jgi:hypothetical protein
MQIGVSWQFWVRGRPTVVLVYENLLSELCLNRFFCAKERFRRD